MFKILKQIGKPLQMDLSTQRRDKLVYPRVLVEVQLGREFLDHIWFENELDQEVMLSLKYEWCLKCVKNVMALGMRQKNVEIANRVQKFGCQNKNKRQNRRLLMRMDFRW